MLLINTAMLVFYAVPVCTKLTLIYALAGVDWYVKVGFVSSVQVPLITKGKSYSCPSHIYRGNRGIAPLILISALD
jgi:hypothetical protein